MSSIRRNLFAGETLYRQGEPATCAWLVEAGALLLHTKDGQRHVDHGRFGAGELVGELGMLEGSQYMATAVAGEESTILAIERSQFQERLDNCDPILRALVASLRQRVRRLHAPRHPDMGFPVEDQPEAGEHDAHRIGIDKIRLETQLRNALADDTLEVRYQPIHDIVEGRVTGYEALVRWELPGRGAVSPGEFIKLAEETSLIVPVGEYVLNRVCGVLQALHARGHAPLPSIAVNLSARQLVEPGMARQILQRIQHSGIPPEALKLEVTDSRMLDYGPVAAVMALCREQGVRFALDDFGTGYSNLTHLHALDFEFVKVDQAFARHMFDSPRAMRIVEAIIALAHAIDAEVVMEGVETRKQLDALQRLGVRYAQGYLVGQAMPAADVLSGEAARGFSRG